MRVALVDASPKPSGSSSDRILRALKAELGSAAETADAGMHGLEVADSVCAELGTCAIWVISYPLYVDGLPATLVSSLLQLSRQGVGKGRTVYAVSNCGFYEGEQTGVSLRMVENWARRAGAVFGGGLGIGGGPALGSFDPAKWAKGPMRPAHEAMEELAQAVRSGEPYGHRFVRLAMPAHLYKLAGELSFRQMLKKNGLKARDAGARPEE